MRTNGIVLALLCSMLAACEQDRSPSELDEAAILAVRITPAELGPGQAGRLDALIADSAGAPRLVVPDEVTVAVPGADAHLAIERGPDGVRIQAPDAVALEAARASFGLGPGEPVRVPLQVRVLIDGVEKVARKELRLGAEAQNPVIASLRVDGAPAEGPVVARAGARPRLAATAAAGAGLRWAWYSGVGQIERYRSADAIWHADEPRTGSLVVVLRDDRGGVAWRTVEARVE